MYGCPAGGDPTEEEARRAEPVVRKMLAQERAALNSGKKTRSEVAAAAMKLAGEADTDAAKLLLMKGAFALYVQDGNLEKAVETMKTLEAAISDMPPQSVTNMIEMALKGASKKVDGERLYKLLNKTKAGIASHSMSKEAASVSVGVESVTEKARKDIARLFPGWSLASEVPQRAEAADHYSGFYASHRGQDNIIRLHPVNRETPVVLSRTVKLSSKNPCLFLRIASWNEESDFLLSVRVNGKAAMPDRLVCTSDVEPWEDLVVPLFDWRGRSVEIEIILSANNWWCEWSHLARIEIAEGNGQEKYGLTGIADLIVDGYTWSYRVRNGEATIVAEKNGKYSCAVSPMPTGDIVIPTTLGGVKVTRIGRDAFANCQGLTSINIPQGVTSIDRGIFWNCSGLKSVALPSSLKTIGMAAFGRCAGLTSVTIPNGVTNIGKDAFQDSGIKSVTIPSSVTNIGISPLAGCRGLMSLSVDSGNPSYSVINGVLCTKDGKNLVAGVNGSVMIPSSIKNINRGAFCAFGRLTSVDIPEGVTNIGYCAFCRCGLKTLTIPSSVKRLEFGAFWGCGGLKSVTINEGMTHIEANAFWLCGGLESVTIPSSVKSLAKDAFSQCGALTSVTMRGERPISPYNIFPGCGKLKAIHVPANAKSWAGMKEWHGIPLVFDGESVNERVDTLMQEMSVVANKLQGCNFLLNKDFKKNAKYYLCLFSASWCGPCRAEMPRIAKTYAETLKDDPNIELIHFSWDQNDEKALAWAKEHDVKFPVVKPKGGNPLDLHTRGIPHLFIVKADGTLVEEGHPMKLFTDEKLCELKAATP